MKRIKKWYSFTLYTYSLHLVTNYLYKAPHAPKDIIDILPMISKTLASGCQEDAHEFLRSLIGAMQLVLSKAFNKKKDQVKLKTMYPYALFHGEVISHVCHSLTHSLTHLPNLTHS